MKRYLFFISGFCLSNLALASTADQQEALECQHGLDLKITFLGNTTLIFQDGLSSFVLDGFVSRSSKRQLFWKHKAKSRVESVFKEKLGMDKIDIITSLHAHYDHAQDVPEIVQKFEARLIGSKSLQNLVCRANAQRQCDLPEPIVYGQAGCFEIQLEPASHSEPRGWIRRIAQNFAAPLGGEIANRDIDSKSNTHLPLPTSGFRWSKHWVEGQSHNVLIRHKDKTIYVYGGKPVDPSNDWLSQADIVFVAIPAYPLEEHNKNIHHAFWQALNKRVDESFKNKKWIIPVHWDDFTKEIPENFIDQPLQKMSGLGARKINSARQALQLDVDAQNAKYDQSRFVYYEPTSYAELINLP